MGRKGKGRVRLAGCAWHPGGAKVQGWEGTGGLMNTTLELPWSREPSKGMGGEAGPQRPGQEDRVDLGTSRRLILDP